MIHYGIYGGVGVLTFAYAIMARFKLLPSIEGVQAFASMLNSKGGNILVLASLSILFFQTAVHMTYWCLDRMNEGKLSVDNAVMMMGLTFITGSCFGGAFSSMLKVMSGEEVRPLEKITTKTITSTVSPSSEPPQPAAEGKL